MKFEHLVPSSWWIQDNGSCYLVLHLPGFNQDEVRIRGDINGARIIVSGQREVANEDKIVRFEQSFKVDEDCNVEEASGTFENDVFYVTMPKIVVPGKEVSEGQKSAYDPGGNENNERTPEEEEESNVMKKILKHVVKHRSAILTGVIAFSLGIFVSCCYNMEGKGKCSQSHKVILPEDCTVVNEKSRERARVTTGDLLRE